MPEGPATYVLAEAIDFTPRDEPPKGNAAFGLGWFAALWRQASPSSSISMAVSLLRVSTQGLHSRFAQALPLDLVERNEGIGAEDCSFRR